jgi:hypothetical protein
MVVGEIRFIQHESRTYSGDKRADRAVATGRRDGQRQSLAYRFGIFSAGERSESSLKVIDVLRLTCVQ